MPVSRGVRQRQTKKQANSGVTLTGSLRVGRDLLRRTGEKQGITAQEDLLSKSRLSLKDRLKLREVVETDRREYETTRMSAQQALDTYENGRLLNSFSDERQWVDFGDTDFDDGLAQQNHLDENENQIYNHMLEDILGTQLSYGLKRAKRSWAQRSANERANWQLQLTDLVYALLEYRACCQEHDVLPPEPDPDQIETGSAFQVSAICWNWYLSTWTIPMNRDEFPNVALIRRGFIGTAPFAPEFAISLRTFDSFYRLQMQQPSLGIRPFVRALCEINAITYRSHYGRAFTSGYDIYLAIHREINKLTSTALRRSSEDFRRSICPCCQHTVAGEEEQLDYTVCLALDGNNALKRFGDAGKASVNRYPTQYILPREYVDSFANEVRQRKNTGKKRKSPEQQVSREDGDCDRDELLDEIATEPAKGSETEAADGAVSDDDPELAEYEQDASEIQRGPQLQVDREEAEEGRWVFVEADPTGTDELVSECVDRWKANADDSKKGMFECFDEAGIFIAICRHGLLIVACDMIRSGELAKYPIAICSTLQELFPGKKLIGYDIGCAFQKTLSKSRVGGSWNGDFVVSAMHGFQHNRACQLKFHPFYHPGTGIEDLETSERFFSASNSCSRCTRHASAFHRHQLIENFIPHSNEQKYALSGSFIYNNWKQSLAIIMENTPKLEILLKSKGWDDAIYADWLREEEEHLGSLIKEPENETFQIVYAEALLKLWKAQEEESEEVRLLREGRPIPVQARNRNAANGSRRLSERVIRPTYSLAKQRVEKAMETVTELEAEARMGLMDRWGPESPSFLAALRLIRERKYRRALDRLERLVVQRLFELQKCHVAGTGYKMRTSIGKHLQTRSKTIRTALREYNAAASKLNKDRLQYKDIVRLSFVSEFDLLRDSRIDIRSRPWAIPANRIICDAYYRVKHAHEEMKRLRVETRRVIDKMPLTEQEYAEAIGRCTDDAAIHSNANVRGHLREELRDRLRRLRLRHAKIWEWLVKLPDLEGFNSLDLKDKIAEGWKRWADQEVHRVDVGDDDLNAVIDEQEHYDTLDGMDEAMARMESLN